VNVEAGGDTLGVEVVVGTGKVGVDGVVVDGRIVGIKVGVVEISCLFHNLIIAK